MTDDVDDVLDPLLGRVIDGRFTIQSVLGRGGMGVVYRAHQASLERSVALKVMTGVAPEREVEFQRRFFLEAATVAKLKHPNTITVFDYGSSAPAGPDGDTQAGERLYFIAMELLEGQTLSQLMAKGRALAPLRAINIALQICRSLREAHKAGVVHRDLKPGNVMLVKQDEGDDVEGDFVKVLDFGLAKTKLFDGAAPIEGITKAGTFMGSPRYVAPEQVEGRPVDARADIYSLGCLMFRMIAGRVPFDGVQPVEIMLKHLHEPVPKLAVPGLPLSLIRLVDECLQKLPADRPPSMDAVLQRLKLVRAELGGTGSGIMVLSDERNSLPPQPTLTSFDDIDAIAAHEANDPLVVDPVPEELRTVVDRPRTAMSPDPPRIVRPRERSLAPAGSAQQWGLNKPMSHEDSTRPTRELGLHLKQRPPRTPWGPIAAGVVVGLVLCTGFIAWRLGRLDPLIARVEAWRQPPVSGPPAPAPAAPAGPHARSARVRIRTVPAGADVLEVQNGLPRLLGITPLTIPWDVEQAPATRELVLRKDGYVVAKATLRAPAPAEREPVWLDVEATLRRE